MPTSHPDMQCARRDSLHRVIGDHGRFRWDVSPAIGRGIDVAGSPTARRRRLAIELKKLREESGLTCNQVGKELDWSGSKVNRLETGQGRVQPSDVDALCRFYG